MTLNSALFQIPKNPIHPPPPQKPLFWTLKTLLLIPKKPYIKPSYTIFLPKKSCFRCEKNLFQTTQKIIMQSQEKDPKKTAWNLNSSFNVVLIFECEIFNQNLRLAPWFQNSQSFLNTKAWRNKKHKRKKIRKKLKLFL